MTIKKEGTTITYNQSSLSVIKKVENYVYHSRRKTRGKVNLSISLKSILCESLHFNTLKIPTLKAKSFYNFFDSEELNTTQEDQSLDPLESFDCVPRYNIIKWDSLSVTEQLSDTVLDSEKTQLFKSGIYRKKLGVLGDRSSNFRNSYEKIKKYLNMINIEGVNRKIPDIHALDKCFRSIANDNLFSNSVLVSLNTNTGIEMLEELPIETLVDVEDVETEEADSNAEDLRTYRLGIFSRVETSS